MNEWYDDMTRVVLVRRIVTRKVIVNDNDNIYRFNLDYHPLLTMNY